MKKIFQQKTAIACASVALLAACSNEAYDTGDGSLSYMRADFVEAITDSNAGVVEAATDDGRRLTLSPVITANWVQAKDSVYRALLYYNNVEDVSSASVVVKPIAIGNVLVPPVGNGMAGQLRYPADPVTLDTAWLSANLRYINLGLYLKTGKTDEGAGKQSVGLVYTGSVTRDDGIRQHTIRFVHDQNGVPEYYSTQVYVSIPLYRLPFSLAKGDAVEVAVNTYDGERSKIFIIE